VTSSIQIDVTQGLAREAVVALPVGLIVNQVAGATVADWNVDRNTLTVTFLEPVSTQTSIVVSGEVRGPRDGKVTIPIVRMPSAERETGGVAVDVVGAGEIAGRQARGLEPADPSELGDVVAGRESPSMVAFRLRPLGGSAARTLTVNVTRYTQQAVLVANVEEARYDALLGEDGKLLVARATRCATTSAASSASRCRRSPRCGAPRSPAGRFGPACLPRRTALPLRKGRTTKKRRPSSSRCVSAARSRLDGEGDAHLDLPAVDLPVSRTGLTLHHSPATTSIRSRAHSGPRAIRSVERSAARGRQRLHGRTADGARQGRQPAMRYGEREERI
jgi:hypothetical protein